MRCTGVFAVTEHELKLLTAGDGTRSTVRDVKREVAAVRGEVEGLADTLSELRSEMASMRNQLTRRHEAMREKLLAEIQAELRQGRGGLRQVIDWTFKLIWMPCVLPRKSGTRASKQRQSLECMPQWNLPKRF